MSKILKRNKLAQDNSYHISQMKASIDALIASHVTDGHTLNQINNPSDDKEFNFANKHLHFKWVAPAAGAHQGAFELEASGAFANDLVHIHQHTGNPGVTNLVYIEGVDTDVKPLVLKTAAQDLVFDNAGLQLGGGDASVTAIKDEDNMASDSAIMLATQQSIKKYVDDNAGVSTATVEAYLGIGIANKRWVTLTADGEGFPGDSSFVTNYANVGADDSKFSFTLSLPYVIGAKNLVVTQYRYGISAADANDYVTRTRMFGWSDFETSATLHTNATDKKTEALITENMADTTIGGVYERVMVYIETVSTDAAQIALSFCQVEYYYT